jgi:hypothetical protein
MLLLSVQKHQGEQVRCCGFGFGFGFGFCFNNICLAFLPFFLLCCVGCSRSFAFLPSFSPPDCARSPGAPRG